MTATHGGGGSGSSSPVGWAAFAATLVGLSPVDQRARARAHAGELAKVEALSVEDRLCWKDQLATVARLPKADFDKLCPPARRPRALRSVPTGGGGGGAGDQADGRPERPVNVAGRDTWRYSLGGGAVGRGIYELQRNGETDHWVQRAELPYVHARLVRRDGSGRRVGVEYLVSAELDGPRAVVPDDDLVTGGWAPRIGANLSVDREIVTAAGTAIRDTAHRDAPEREATPRPDIVGPDGYLDVPIAETLPAGYLCAPPGVSAEQSRAAMVEVARILAGQPAMALTLGASVAGPFVGPLRRQSFWLDLYGDARQGKSTALAVAAAVWGDPRKGTGAVVGWDASAKGPGRVLGQLGILPAFFDERGEADMSGPEWARMIYSTCEGSSRLTAERIGSGTRRTPPWFGVLCSTGNARLLDGIAAGKFAGVAARVLEFPTPLTCDAGQAKRLTDELLPVAYGWLGQTVLAAYPVAEVRRLLAEAETTVGVSVVGGVAGTLAEHLYLAVAGAAMADAVLGIGSALTDAAVIAAREYLAMHGHEPEHDADRILAALGESLAARRSAWPSEADYALLGTPDTGVVGGAFGDASKRHGFDHQSSGILSRDGEWVYVFPAAWKAITEEIGADSAVAAAELHRRRVLHVPASLRRRGQWQAQPRVDGRKLAGCYQVSLAATTCVPLDDGPGDGPVPDSEGRSLLAPGEQLPAGQQETVLLETPAPCSVCGLPCEFGWPTVPRHPSCGEQLVLLDDQAEPVDQQQPGQPAGEPVDQAAEPVDQQRPGQPAGEPVDQTAGLDAQAATPRPGAAAVWEAVADGTVDTYTRAPVRTARREGSAARRAAEQAEVTRQAIADLDAGKPLRGLGVLGALEGAFAPRRRDADGGYRPPFWRPPLPEITFADPVQSGWEWSREFGDGPLSVLDRSGAWVAAASSVTVAHGALRRTGPMDSAARPSPGYYQVAVYDWREGALPSPLGYVLPGRVTKWVTGPTLALLYDLAAAGRWPDTAVLDSYTGDPVRLRDWATYVNALRAHAIRNYGRGSDQYAAVKRAFGQATSLMLGKPGPGGQREWIGPVRRPDWTHAIQSQAAVTIWRCADDCRQMVPEHPPVALRNVDELVLPTAAVQIVTTSPRPGGRPPMRLDPDGITLGSFKLKAVDDTADIGGR